MRWIALLALALACKSRDAPPPGPQGPTMPAAEIKRARESCQAYANQVCACARTVPAMQERCKQARALPEAIDVAIDVAAGSESTRRDVRQIEGSVRNIVKECIEQLARFLAAGCPAPPGP
jgi:hypothetical protein